MFGYSSSYGYGDPWGMSHGSGPGVYDTTLTATPLSGWSGPMGVYGGDYGSAASRLKIRRLQKQIRSTRDPRKRRALQAKLRRLEAQELRAAQSAARKRGIQANRLRLAPQKRLGPGLAARLKPRKASQRQARRLARLQARLSRRALRQEARRAKQAAKQAMKDSGAPMDPMLANDLPEYMQESGIISDSMSLPLPPPLPDSGLDADLYDEETGTPWGKIAIGLGVVLAMGVAYKAISGSKAKGKAKGKAKAKRTSPSPLA